MRGIAFALAALAFAATTADPAAAQCYGPECDPRQSNAPSYYNERPNFHSQQSNGQPYRSAPYEQNQPYRQAPYQGQPYRSAPYQQAQPYQPSPHQGPPHQSVPYHRGQPYQSAPYHQGQPYQQMPPSQQTYQRPVYQTQPRPPAGYSNIPPGMGPGAAPRGPGYHPAYSNGRMDVQTRVTKISRPANRAVRQQQRASNNRAVVRGAPRTAGNGQITISVAEYRDLQNQARELQRLRSSRPAAPSPGPGAPNGLPLTGPSTNGASPFPQVPPPAAGVAPQQ